MYDLMIDIPTTTGSVAVKIYHIEKIERKNGYTCIFMHAGYNEPRETIFTTLGVKATLNRIKNAYAEMEIAMKKIRG